MGVVVSNYKGYDGYVWPVRGGQFWSFGSLIISTSPKFGTTPVGASATPRQIEIGNRGGAALAVTSIALSGTNYQEFSITSGGSTPCGSLSPTLAAGASCTLMLGFSPTVSGAKIASLDVTANGITGSVPLSDAATAPLFYTLTSVFAGTGDGSVHSSPLTDINCIKGQTAGCSAAFATGSTVTLTATPNSSTSTFGSWSNACTSVPCNIPMSGDKTAVVTFNLAPKTKIALAASTGFDTLQLAYTSATTTIFALDGLFTGEWTLDDGGKNIVFTGGYLADYGATRGGFTVLGGKLTVKAGALRVDGLKVR